MIRFIPVAIALLVIAGCGGESESTQETSETTSSTATTLQATTITATDAIVDGADTTPPSDTTAETTTASVEIEGSETDEEAAVESAVRVYVAAFGEGDPDAAVALLSQRCADTIPIPSYRAAVASAGELYPGLVVDVFSDIVLDEDAAVVYYTTDPEVEEGDGERWVVESGTWRWDDC